MDINDLQNQIFMKMGLSGEEGYRKLGELFGTTGTIRRILPKGKRNILSKKDAALLHIISGLDLNKFYLPFDEEKKQLEKEAKPHLFFTRNFREKILEFKDESNINIASYNPPLDANSDSYLAGYLNEVQKYFDEAQDSILVIEKLFKGNNQIPSAYLTQYREAHEELFKIIENKLKQNPNFRYVRLFCLSPSTTLHNKLMEPFNQGGDVLPKVKEDNDKKDDDRKKELEDAFRIEASTEVLLHLKRCLKIRSSACSFRISPETRFRHQCLIDHSVLLTEDYMKVENCVIPDEIIVDKVIVNKNKKIGRTRKTKNLSNKMLERFFALLYNDMIQVRVDIHTLNTNLMRVLEDKLENRGNARMHFAETFRCNSGEYNYEFEIIKNRLIYTAASLIEQQINIKDKRIELDKI